MVLSLVAVLSAAVAGGCYRYVPIDDESPALGSAVRVELTDAGALTMAPLIGARIESVDGRVTSAADTALTLTVTGTTDRFGNEVSWRGEQVVIPRSALAGFRRRTLDRKRSYLFGGVAVGLVAAVGVGFGIDGSGGGGGGGASGSPK
jgi:hypothetical protein